MASRRPVYQSLDDYPRPWFYRPEIYFAFILFPPVWSVLTLRSPWHKGEGFFGIMVGGLAWFFIIFIIVMSYKWGYQEGNWQNLFVMPVPGLLLTLLTQVQWAAHCAQHGQPPVDGDGDGDDEPPVVANPKTPTPRRRRRRRRG